MPRPEPSVTVTVDRTRSASHAVQLPDLAGEAGEQAARLVGMLGPEGLVAASDRDDVAVAASSMGTGARVLLMHRGSAGDETLVRLTGMTAGMKRATIYRIDDARRWRDGELEPLEVRETPDPEGEQEQRLFLPAGSVALLCLDEVRVRPEPAHRL